MSVSPDGSLLAFRQRLGEEDAVLVLSLAEKKFVTGLNVASIRPTELYFLNNARVIMVAADEDFVRGYRSHHRISGAFSLDISTGEPQQLLKPGRLIIANQLDFGNIVGASADGQRIFMSAYTSRAAGRDPDYSLVEVDLTSELRTRILERGSAHTVDFFVDDRGQVLVEEIFNDHDDLHRIIAYANGEGVEIYRDKSELPRIGIVALTADRKSLIFDAISSEHDRNAYYTMSLADGAVSEPIFTRPDADIEGILRDVNRVAYGVVYSGLRPSYAFFDRNITQAVTSIQAKFPGNSVWLTDTSPDLRHLIVRVEGSTSSGDYYLYSGDDTIRFLLPARSSIAREYVHPVIEYEYEARDGAKIPSLLTVPSTQKDNAHDLPAVMLPHGGPEAHDWVTFDWLAQALASQGYAVIQPQFRGSTGFGLEHMLAGRGEWGKRSQDDITDALAHLVREQTVDPDRVCIAGVSYGGFAALAGGAFTPGLYKCVVSVNGVSDVRRMLQQEKRELGGHHWAISYWTDVIALGDTSKHTLDTISPANYAANFTAPVLLVHGDRDGVVAYDQSRHMEKQLKRADKSVKLVTLKGEDHQLSDPVTRMECLKAVVDFVNQHLGRET